MDDSPITVIDDSPHLLEFGNYYNIAGQMVRKQSIFDPTDSGSWGKPWRDTVHAYTLAERSWKTSLQEMEKFLTGLPQRYTDHKLSLSSGPQQLRTSQRTELDYFDPDAMQIDDQSTTTQGQQHTSSANTAHENCIAAMQAMSTPYLEIAQYKSDLDLMTHSNRGDNEASLILAANTQIITKSLDRIRDCWTTPGKLDDTTLIGEVYDISKNIGIPMTKITEKCETMRRLIDLSRQRILDAYNAYRAQGRTIGAVPNEETHLSEQTSSSKRKGKGRA